LLHIGDILNPHGLKGAFIVYSHTRPADAVAGYSCWHLGKSESQNQPFIVKRCWQHGKRMLALVEGVENIDDAASLKGLKIWVNKDEVPCDEDEYLWQTLIGCRVIDQQGNILGVVQNLHEFGAQDTLDIKTLPESRIQGEWLLPFIDDVVINVDIEQKIIHINLLEGMDACFTVKS